MADKKEEDKNVRNESNIVTLNRTSDKTIDPKHTDTIHDEKNIVTTKDPTTTTEYKQSWLYNDDGTINQPLLDYYNEQLKQKQKLYHYDPKTGDIDRGTLFDVLGVKPEQLKEQREKEMRRNRMKQLGSALFNSGALISDMISAGLGGNVWKREKDNTAEQAHAANVALEREQAADDMKNAAIVNNARNAYYNAMDTLNKNMERYNRTLKVTTGGGTKRTETGGNTHTTTSGGGVHENATQEQQLRKYGNGTGSGSGSGNGGGGGKTVVNVMGSNGVLQKSEVSKEDAKSLIAHAESVYEKAIRGGDQELYDLLHGRGLVTYNSNSGKYEWDNEAMQRSGYLFNVGSIDKDLSKSIKAYYRSITGDNRPIRTTSKQSSTSETAGSQSVTRWGKVTPTKEEAEEEYDD